MLLGTFILYISCFYAKLAWSFSFSVTPSPLSVNETFQISWIYEKGDSPDGVFAIEVQGAASYLQWFGFYNSSGSTTVAGLPMTGTYTLAAYSNGQHGGNFFTTMFSVNDQGASQNEISTVTTTISTVKQTASIAVAASGNIATSSSSAVVALGSVSSSTTAVIATNPTTSISSSSPMATMPAVKPSSQPSNSSISPLSATPSPATSSSSSPSSSPSSNTKISAVITGASTCAGALLFFVVVGLCIHVRRRRKNRKTAKGKVAPTPYEFAYPRRFSSNLSRSPNPQMRLKDALQGVGAPQPNQLQPNRLLSNEGELQPAQFSLTQDTRNTRISYDTEVDSPSYGFSRVGHAF